MYSRSRCGALFASPLPRFKLRGVTFVIASRRDERVTVHGRASHTLSQYIRNHSGIPGARSAYESREGQPERAKFNIRESSTYKVELARARSDPTRVAAGLKAAIHNPNVSEGAKINAAERLEQMEGGAAETGDSRTDEHTNRVLGGFRATLSNKNTSPEAKRHAKEVLDAAGYDINEHSTSTEDEHDNRVLGGYKAALHNPNVSAAAKEHAREILREYGAL
ncbi:hypothetical protein HWV62_34105 [Athelia sp. TMB]|nr:hypothetical protein HWV62_34105 [Athelia sp. TMB]